MKHIHQAKYDENGKLLSECAKCGKSFRNTNVHLTAGEKPALPTAELAETQRRIHEANERMLQALNEQAAMTRRYTAAAELNKRLLEQIKAYRVSAKLVHGAKDTQYIDELIEQAEAALAKEVPHV